MGTGTTSDADYDAKATRRTSYFLDNRRVATGFGISREALSKRIPWAQARLQMQIGHARATSERSLFYIVDGFL